MTLDLTDLPAALRHEGGVSRRLFLAYSAALATIPLLGEPAHGAIRNAAFQDNPFSLGVASGDPDHTGFVIWTRLAPQPLEPNGGMPPAPVEVQWEVSDDEAGKTIVKSGTAIAASLLGIQGRRHPD
ncbi:MAG: PhoD-like phosphatase N-terminal domain-containing protein, partial [Armatimonadota bacterium]